MSKFVVYILLKQLNKKKLSNEGRKYLQCHAPFHVIDKPVHFFSKKVLT